MRNFVGFGFKKNKEGLRKKKEIIINKGSMINVIFSEKGLK